VTLDDIVGVYVADHEKGLDILKINPDGTYEHFYTEKNRKSHVNRNKWSFEIVDNIASGITFTDFHFYFRGRKTGGYWYTEVDYDIFGKARFCLDPDLYHYYVKETPAKETSERRRGEL
jgi:hypothetical protein